MIGGALCTPLKIPLLAVLRGKSKYSLKWQHAEQDVVSHLHNKYFFLYVNKGLLLFV